MGSPPRLDDTIQETESRRSEESANTRCHQLRDAAMKDTAGVGVELRHIYSSGRRSHHTNGAPRPAKPNLTTERGDRILPPYCRWSRRRERGPARPVEIGWKRRSLPDRLWRLGQGTKEMPLSSAPPHLDVEVETAMMYVQF
jgi:hypothetical protein